MLYLHRFIVAMLVIVALSFAALFVLAQDEGTLTPSPTIGATLPATVVPTAVPFPGDTQPQPLPLPSVYTPPVPSLGDFLSITDGSLRAIFAGLLAFLATTPLVSFLKRFPPFNLKNKDGDYYLSGEQINLLVAFVLSVITWGAASLGYASQVNQVWQFVFATLPILAGTGANFAANKVAYTAARSAEMPIVGYSRTLPNVPPQRPLLE